MTPFTTNTMTPAPNLSVDDDPASHTGSHNDAEYQFCPGCFTPDNTPIRLRKRKTIRVIRQLHPYPKPAFQVLLQGFAIQDDSITILHRMKRRVQHTRSSDADGSG